jgi:hypothetical protein
MQRHSSMMLLGDAAIARLLSLRIRFQSKEVKQKITP